MLPIVETNGKTLYINSNKVTFPYKIEQVLILKSQILILLDSCIKNEYDNVYSVNFDGTIGWRVQSRKYLSREYENKKLKEKVNKLKISIDYFDDVINSEVPNRMILKMLIDKIYINRDKMIKFELKTDIKKMI